MGGTWRYDDPPTEAYSRVTRDLAQVTAGFARYLDDLPSRLTATRLCSLRDLNAAETTRLDGGRLSFRQAYAIEPGDPDCATLLVGRGVDAGHWAVLALGRVTSLGIPSCSCDGCDEDSDDMIDDAESFVEAAVQGCTEFRTRSRFSRWVTEGYSARSGSSAASTARGRAGKPFVIKWKPWPVE